MAKQSLSCLNVFARVDQKSREAVTEVVEAESLTRFEPEFYLRPLRGVLPFIFVEGKAQSSGFT